MPAFLCLSDIYETAKTIQSIRREDGGKKKETTYESESKIAQLIKKVTFFYDKEPLQGRPLRVPNPIE